MEGHGGGARSASAHRCIGAVGRALCPPRKQGVCPHGNRGGCPHGNRGVCPHGTRGGAPMETGGAGPMEGVVGRLGASAWAAAVRQRGRRSRLESDGRVPRGRARRKQCVTGVRRNGEDRVQRASGLQRDAEERDRERWCSWCSWVRSRPASEVRVRPRVLSPCRQCKPPLDSVTSTWSRRVRDSRVGGVLLRFAFSVLYIISIPSPAPVRTVKQLKPLLYPHAVAKAAEARARPRAVIAFIANARSAQDRGPDQQSAQDCGGTRDVRPRLLGVASSSPRGRLTRDS